MLLFNAKVIEVVPTANVAAPETAKVPVILEFPVIVAPPLETVKAPVLNVPVIYEFPRMAAPFAEIVNLSDSVVVPVIVVAPVIVAPLLVTVKPDGDVKPVQTIAFVVSNPIEYFPKFGPTVVVNENIIGALEI